jgi:hypothetical protein
MEADVRYKHFWRPGDLSSQKSGDLKPGDQKPGDLSSQKSAGLRTRKSYNGTWLAKYLFDPWQGLRLL